MEKTYEIDRNTPSHRRARDVDAIKNLNNIAGAGDAAEVADGEPQKEGGSFFDLGTIKRVCLIWSQYSSSRRPRLLWGGGGGDDLKESHSIDNNVVECLLETGVELLERSRRGL